MTEASDTGAADEAGFTLVELLVAVAMGLVVFGATMAVLVSSLHANDRGATKNAALQSAEVAVGRMIHDIRAAAPVSGQDSVTVMLAGGATSGSRLVVDRGGAGAKVSGANTITYDCTADERCTRAVGTGNPVPFVTRVVNARAGGATVFSLSRCSDGGAGCTFVGVDLEVRATCAGRSPDCDAPTVGIDDGTDVRNAIHGEQ